MSGIIEGEDRHQATLFPECLDEYVAEDNAVRVIDVFIDDLDLTGLGLKTKASETGRPAYHPATMLKLYVYGYLNRIQSSRRLEREAQRNVELMWLVGGLAPDFKTIADFPEQIAGWLKRRCPGNERYHVSHETIYKSLFIQARGVLKQELLACLRTQRVTRRPRRASLKGKGLGRIVDAVPISARPPSVEDRAVPGHWEGDILVGSHGSHVGSRYRDVRPQDIHFGHGYPGVLL